MLNNVITQSESPLHRLTHRITEQFFGCTHANLSWPRTIKTATGKHCYCACLNCGSELPFDADLWQRI